MWSVTRIKCNYVTLLVAIFSICSCEGKIGPFGALEPETDTGSERSTGTETDFDTATGSDSDSGADSGNDNEVGLMGQYFRRYGFKDIELCRHDENIDFDWTKADSEDIPTGNGLFVKWDGWVTPEFSETYTFKTVSDDGVRLRINGELIIDDWYIHYEEANTGTATLLAGVSAEISLEYFSVPDDSLVSLSWESPSLPMEIIPAGKFTSASCTDPPQDLPPVPVEGSCLQADDFSDNAIDPVWQLNPLGPVGDVSVSEADAILISVKNGYYVGGVIDSCAFLSQPVLGNVDVSFRVESFDTKAPKAEMGIMMRNSLEPDSQMVFIGLTGFNEVNMVARNEVGTLAESLTDEPLPSLPYWARLVRTGNLFEGYISADGINWQFINSVTVPLNEDYLVGIAQSTQLMTSATGVGGRFVVTTGGCK